ncbi:MAG: restriction endonuclease subunit S [Limnospira sp. PMC 1291.21]|uniref:Restriction modification system DNA specificity domain n=1 Tax=Limnospira maxima CS-328 TaxID=513049 RepID=B5VW68_LIMMA|nr:MULTISPECIES: restriction endonuclease subunit S [Limnospira]MDC0839320.1 restriction endonuclease subunit S [Limnoraphis robusta]EDZ96429.1 restriction modification system DNA specificity domain [Limnospira maxima CS-328]MDT9176518.1 restriction endonuclease subunit S [Limnospira sp. PMC 1238.20]MDT9186237.1 restriction endonuclease subunit S [Limnospira sp. PMC 894.15]MDT9191615.1 restriction endonuclease subunit S [Limnospira sp. PMC 1245.20]
MNFIKTATNYHDLSSMPLGWKKSYVKYLGNYINGYPFKPDNWSFQGKPILRIQNLSNPNADFNRYEGEISEAYLVHKGDILISWSASLGVYKWLGEDAWLNQHIFKVEINTKLVFEEYFVWLASWFIKELEHKAHGSTMQHLTWNAFGNFPVLLPPMPEQKAIAHYLDKETAKIDQLIEAKKRLLELLDEKRRALITHAVTRGLNPDVPMRDSGVEWIGEIPKHWKVEFAKWLFKEIDDRSTTGQEELLTVSHITGITPRSEKDVNMFKAESMEGYKVCQSGDLIINTLWAWMGAMGVSFQPGIVSPSYHVYRPQGEYHPVYLDYLVRIPIFAEEAIRYSKGVWISRLRLYPEEFFQILLPVPPLEEQYKIGKYLMEKTKKLDNLSIATKKTMDLLQERRTSLITAAVTGQLKIS